MRVNISTVAPLLSNHPRLLLLADGGELAGLLGPAFEIVQTTDVSAALAALEREPADVVVATHDPPRRDVFALCAELRRPMEQRLIPVVGVAPAGAGLALAAAEAGVDQWFEGRPDPAYLRARIGALLRSWGMYRAVEAKARGLMLIHDWVRYLVHDLRNPLGVGLGNVHLAIERLGEGTERDAVRVILGDAARALDHVSSLINDLLDSDRIRHGALRLERKVLQLGQLAREAVEALRPEATRRRREISFVERADTTVDADAALLRRVCTNLIDNAIRHGSEGEVEVSVEGSMMEVVVRVSNRGPAISASAGERLFDPWTRLDGESQGLRTGLGLAFARIVVEAHGGRIWVEPTTDDRVVFAWAIPRAVAE